MEKIHELIDKVKQNPNNDYNLPYLFLEVVEYVHGKVILSEVGRKMLDEFDINADTEKLNLEPMHQRTLTRCSLYFTMCYNLSALYCGYITILETPITPEIDGVIKSLRPLPVEITDFLLTLQERTNTLMIDYAYVLEMYGKRLMDKYAMLYNGEKRRCFAQNVFNTTLRIPTQYPDGYESAQQVRQ